MDTTAETPASPPGRAWMRWLLLPIFVLLVLRAGWLSDDAYISFRAADNLAHGLGLRWNPAERVQAFTNPLWTLAFAALYRVTDEAFFTGIALGAVVSAAAFAWFLRRAPSSLAGALGALIGGGVLATSKAFVDFSTSGLENPLVHLLLAIALGVFACEPDPRRAAPRLTLLAALLAVTRLDAVLLIAPLVVTRALQARERATLLRCAAMTLPLVAWELFSIAYYGFPFPNTAYAKLSTGLPAGELALQGLHYLANSLRTDPITLPAILVGLGLAAARRETRPLAVAILLHLLYVVKVGGDFMSGRFLTAPLLVAAFALARAPWPRPAALAAGAAVLAIALLNPRSPLRAPSAYGLERPAPEHVDARGITDERAYWYGYLGLWSPDRPADSGKPHVTRGHPLAARWRAAGPSVQLANGVGTIGFFAGPQVHVVDPMGLPDPLLARLPIADGGELLDPQGNAFRDRPWRIGHFVRVVPEGYLDTLGAGEDRLASPALGELWEDLALVTRGPLWSGARWGAMWRLWTGGVSDRVEDWLVERRAR